MKKQKGRMMMVESLAGKLRNLQLYMPEADSLVIEFARVAADYMPDDPVPGGFNMACHLAINDLQTGINGYTGLTVQSSLIGYPQMIYTLLLLHMEKIAASVLGAEFAEELSQLRRRPAEASK